MPESPDEFYASQSPGDASGALRSIWDKPVEVREFERKQFVELKSRNDEICNAQLSNCYAWTQSQESVTFVVWIQGHLDETVVEVKEPRHVLVQTDGFPAVVDEDFAYDIDADRDADSVSWENLDLIAFKVFKKNRGEKWLRLFRNDTYMARAVDFKPFAFDDEEEQDDSSSVSFQIFGSGGTDVTICRDHIRVEGLVPFVKHFKWHVDLEASSWTKTERGVSVTVCVKGGGPKKRKHFRKDGTETNEVSDFYADVPDIPLIKRLLFVEEEDGMLAGTVAEMMAFMDYGGEARWKSFESLSVLSQNIFNSLLPPHVRDQYAFEEESEENDDPRTILQWWETTPPLPRHHQRAEEEEEDDEDDEPIVEILEDDDDETVAVPPPPPPPLAPGGMLGNVPVKIASSKKAPPGDVAKQQAPRRFVTDYAFDSGGSKTTVKVYVDFKTPIEEKEDVVVDFSESSVFARMDSLAFQAQQLAHRIDPARSSYKIKQPSTVVLSLKKLDATKPWGPNLMRDLNAEDDD